MKLIVKLISLTLCLVFFLIFICIPASIIVLCIDEKPQIEHNTELTVDNIKKAKHIIDENRPKMLHASQKRTLRLSENEINLLLSYAISQGLDASSVFSQATVMENRAGILFTFMLPKRFFGDYVNLEATVEEKNHLVELSRLRIGQLIIPKMILTPVISLVHKTLLHTSRYADLWGHTRIIDRINLEQKQLVIGYRLNHGTVEGLKETGRSFLLPAAQQQRLVQYHNHLSDLTHAYKTKKNPVIDMSKQMIAFARQNTAKSNDPVLENTAAIQVLSLYVLGTQLDRFLAKNHKSRIRPAYRSHLKLHNRPDLAKHFFVSAALAVSAGSKFATLIGIAKEVDDADGGSGFSFADLAADKAGVRFGEFAVSSTSSAERFQKKMSQLKKETDMMPSISNLPEGITLLEFKTTYNDLDSRTYQLINREIESRLAGCRLYRE